MLRFFKQYFLPLLAAILLSVSRLPLYLGWLVFFALIPLLYHFKHKQHSLKENAVSGLIFSGVQILLVFYWIGSVTFVGLIGIWLLYGLYYLICFSLIQRVQKLNSGLYFLVFLSIFISFEFLQNYGEMRFPWWNLGYSLADYLPLLQALEIGGMTLLAILIISINFLFYLLLQRKLWPVFAISAIILLWFGYGKFRLLTLPVTMQQERIGVMQPSIPQDEKWDAKRYREILDIYAQLNTDAAQKNWDLLIYPEAAIPDYLLLNPQVRQDFEAIHKGDRMSVFAGFPHAEKAPADHPEAYYSYNAATIFDPNGRAGELYFKNILVPVGERMLWLNYFPILWKLQFGQANWEFGTAIPRYALHNKSFSPSICYELAFPHFMQRANFQTLDGRLEKVNFHVNITNDAWFGTSYGPWLHAAMTRFRAIESRVQIYRSANTGISMIVNPKGEILRSAPLFERTNITAPLYVSPTIPLYQKLYGYPWILVILAFILCLYSFMPMRRAK
jgi:apolipoprotein N-acyltransferase